MNTAPQPAGFTIRAYTKKELALMYFPYSSPRVSVNHLMSWIKKCPPLAQRLLDLGYNPRAKGFTPLQTEAIVAFFGPPVRTK